jgi:hypothetical protein
MQKTADNLHKELLEMISSLSDGTDMDKASSVCTFSYQGFTDTKYYAGNVDAQHIK